ncbi:unnamed protein product [Rotaria sp. Silwood2]|nr:unnamed protein product [Rotaria sp. Silwood2]
MSSSSSTSSSNESAALSLSSSSTIRQRSNTNIVTGEELVESVLSYVKELKVAKNFKLKIERQLRNINFQENEADNTTTAEPDDTTTVESDNDTAVERDQTCDSNCRSRTINYAWNNVRYELNTVVIARLELFVGKKKLLTIGYEQNLIEQANIFLNKPNSSINETQNIFEQVNQVIL